MADLRTALGRRRTDLAGFVHTVDWLTPAQIARDPVVSILERLGLGAQLATLIAMPSGEMVGLAFERRLEQGRHPPEAVTTLDGLRPHLARAALIAARLGLERARAAVATLEALGLPSAVLASGGRGSPPTGSSMALPRFCRQRMVG